MAIRNDYLATHPQKLSEIVSSHVGRIVCLPDSPGVWADDGNGRVTVSIYMPVVHTHVHNLLHPHTLVLLLQLQWLLPLSACRLFQNSLHIVVIKDNRSGCIPGC